MLQTIRCRHCGADYIGGRCMYCGSDEFIDVSELYNRENVAIYESADPYFHNAPKKTVKARVSSD